MSRTQLLPSHGTVYLEDEFLELSRAAVWFKTLKSAVRWEQRPVKIFGKEVMQPRLTAAFADEGVVYRYSGLTIAQEPWLPQLLEIKRQVEKATGHPFNTALLNLYRNGNDYMGWHRDNEKALGPEPVVASVSLGAARVFQLRRYDTKKNLISISLPSGSLLVMAGESQKYWEHRLPKISKPAGERLNVTFRLVPGK